MKLNTWDLSPLLKGDNDPSIEKKKKEYEKEIMGFVNKWKKREDYLKDAKILKQALDDYENLERKYGNGSDVYYYFNLRTSQDQVDPNIKASFNKISELKSKLNNEIRFFELNLSKINPKDQGNLLKSSVLKDYSHFLSRVFAQSKHLLSEKEENILNLKKKVSHSNWENMLSGFLSKEERETLNEKGKQEKKNFWELMSLISNPNKKIRDDAALKVNGVLKKFEDVAEIEINSLLENKKINDDLRGFKRPDESRHLSDDIETVIVDSLIKEVSSRFDVPKRYYKLKAALLKVKKLDYHERNVPYGKTEQKYPYDEAVKLLKSVFGELDSEFLEIFNNFVNKGSIDVYPYKNKRGGAYCTYSTITSPVYILMNYTDKLEDVLTLAHECGHGINDEMMRKKQNELNFGTPLATAEVASTFMEDFALKKIMEKSDDETKFEIAVKKLNDDVSTIFRQVACYKFEQELHSIFREKGYLSKEEIGEIFQKHMAAYMGDYVKQSEDSKRWWIYWPHIRDFFYTYSYASGLLISKVLQHKVRENKEFVGRVKEFLSAGVSRSPREIFLKLGIDISNPDLWKEGVNEIEASLNEAEKLAKKLGKI